MNFKPLSEDEVMSIHFALVDEFSGTKDPIEPAGVKSKTLLGSAVSRQFTSHAGVYKYPDPLSSAATLTFGLCNDHPFHNGNKRTALVAMIAHLDKNGFSLVDTKHNDLYKLILDIAEHKVGLPHRGKRSRFIPERPTPEVEVEAIAHWIKQRAKKVKKGERQVTYRHFRRILGKFGYSLERPNNNSIEVVRYEEKQVGLFNKTVQRLRKHIASIPYPGDNATVSSKTIKYVRGLCGLKESDGIDSDAFYADGAIVDSFINKYRGILQKLAHR